VERTLLKCNTAHAARAQKFRLDAVLRLWRAEPYSTSRWNGEPWSEKFLSVGEEIICDHNDCGPREWGEVGKREFPVEEGRTKFVGKPWVSEDPRFHKS